MYSLLSTTIKCTFKCEIRTRNQIHGRNPKPIFFAHFTFNVLYSCSMFLRRRLQRIKLNGNSSRARSCLPFTRTLALVKIVSTWISLSLPAFHGCRSLLLPPFSHFSPYCVSVPGADLIRDSALDLIRYTAVCMP